MINQLIQKSTYWLAGLAIVFIVSIAFAQRDEVASVADKDSQSNSATTYLASIHPQKNIRDPLTQNKRPKTSGNLIDELDKRIHAYPQDYEASLLKVFAYIESAEYKKAKILLDDLIETKPEFKIAYLVRGDLFAMQVRPVLGVGNNDILKSLTVNIKDQKPSRLKKLRDELNIRLENFHQQYVQQKIPRALLLMSKTVDTAILIDKSKNRLYVFKRQNDLLPPKLIQDFYVSTGKLRGNKFIKGDLKTPEGVYFVTKWIPDGQLPDKYGIGAFPVNYPNELDNRMGKTGYGIWLHGTKREYYSRPPLDSEGCVVLPNLDLDAIKHLITPGKTPMIIAESIDWVEYKSWSDMRKNVLSSIEAWRRDWQSLDVDKYLQHYDENFWSGRHNIKTWRARKKLLSQSKKYQNIKFDDISLFAYPNTTTTKDNIVVARFHQRYQSNNYNSDMDKRIYLTKNKERWKIIFEGK